MRFILRASWYILYGMQGYYVYLLRVDPLIWNVNLIKWDRTSNVVKWTLEKEVLINEFVSHYKTYSLSGADEEQI